MRIERIRLKNFRAHSDTSIQWDDGVNLLVGANGAGKTNVLEAIHVLCLSRSFLAPSDRYVLQKGAGHYEVEGTFISDDAGAGMDGGMDAGMDADVDADVDANPDVDADPGGGRSDDHTAEQPDKATNNARGAASRRYHTTRVRVAFAPGQGKKVFVNGAPLERISDLVGRVPVVVFSPDDHRITSEGPDERRKMLNTIMCQWSSVYMDELIQYRRVLKQRNELLRSARRSRRAPDPTLMASWNAEFIKHAASVTSARLRFVEDFSDFLEQAYERVSDVTRQPTITYEPFQGITSPVGEELIREAFEEELDRSARTERERGVTQTGPHRDELIMRLGDLPVRRYASQGQHRTFGMALKLAQYDFLRMRTDERPVLLLDDVFDNLDPDRITAFLEVLKSEAIGQSITTAARREIVLSYFQDSGDRATCKVIEIKGGERTSQELIDSDPSRKADVAIP